MADATAPDFSDPAASTGLTTIPLSQLLLSKLNVRQTERDVEIASLAESIAVHGLKQNLVVVPAHFTTSDVSEAWDGKDRWADKFEVIAGGRRFQAMQQLVEQDRLAPTYPVPCLVEDREQARETSLIENLERHAMNAADEFDAYAAIVARHSARPEIHDANAIEICAKRFGKSVKHVEGRLRLAALAPEILEALRTNAIGVDSAKAYASVEDHGLQLKVFAAQGKSNWQPHHPASVRSAMREKTLSANDGLVKFVGLDAYVEAGGRIEAEMFMGTMGDQQRVVDVKLIEKLAKDKAEPMIAPQAKKDGFKSGLLASGVSSSARWPKAPDGMDRYYSYYESKTPTKAQLKKCVAVYAIAHDGIGIEKQGHYRPTPVKEPQEERDWAAERAEEQRQFRIERRAAQLAVYELGKFAGTPFEGRAFWPAAMARPVAVEIDDEAHAMVAVLVRVPVDRISANREEAERLIAEETAAAEAKKAEAEAAEAQRRKAIDSALDDPEAQAEDQADADA
ncbi:ParB/RepB/Spo0J family partition protein [Novosphingobium sp. AP12]|uniref:ParB/RepB/Spo0J family partition protein n=1 Tax=Novosphingobium sp. AP12 TaxID=1144305 RepID=UPI0002721EE1|nr:ParB/RepB/Spo0J family partition protein [Novosphingobium sp. AP12]EJL30090.1 putative transcriptional regulator [Novosphingobium sp. AP12]